MANPAKRVALITGCSDPSSLGAALALCLVKRGWKVYASALQVESMASLKAEGCELIKLDITSSTDISSAVSTIGPRLDLLINNAAVEGFGPLLDTDPQQLLEMYNINVFAPLALVQALAEPLIRSKGCVVNIGSVGVSGLPFHGVYASSKAAFQILSDVLRRETAPLGMRVITVELAMVMTAMLRAENPFPLSVPESSRSPHFTNWYTTMSPTYRADIEKRYPQAISASKAAKQIIDAVEGAASGKIWIGTMAWIFRWMWPFLSTSRQDKINSDLLHMNLLLDRTT